MIFYIISLVLALFWAVVSGWSPPEFDCSQNLNTAWCDHALTMHGLEGFCITHATMMKSTCRTLWCHKCPNELQKEKEAVKSATLDKLANQDVSWKETKEKFKEEFKLLGLDGELDPNVVTPEQLHRYELFLNTTDEIEEIKKEVDEPIEFEMDINKFAIMTKDEKASHAGTKAPQDLPAKAPPSAPSEAKLNNGTDWRPVLESAKDIMDQGFCGSCWAITAASAVESAYEVLSGTRVKFSPQELLDCSTNGINKGCDSGLPHFGLEYVRDHGLESWDVYPYVSYQKRTGRNPCLHANVKVKTFIDSFDYFYSGDVSVNVNFDSTESDKRLMEILDVMPVAGAIASNRLFSYSNGIYNNKKCLGPLNHAVLIAGYGTSDSGVPYWIIKNSWGASWGEQGYIRVKRGNYCGVGQYWAYPKKLKLCPKFLKPDCDAHPDCSWYGDVCDIKAEKCGTNSNKLSCQFFGCYWNEEIKQCMPPTTKCVLDENLKMSKDNCNQSPHCEWDQIYGVCNILFQTCSIFTNQASCALSQCKWTGATCTQPAVPGQGKCPIYKTDQLCKTDSDCMWYGNSCGATLDHCLNFSGSDDCRNNGCTWFGQWCNAKISLCSSLSTEFCIASNQGCFESSRLQDKSKVYCDPLIANICLYDIGIYNSSNVKQNCESWLFCQWDGKICKAKDSVCNEMKDGSDCNSVGCEWSNGVCQPLQAYPCAKIVTKEYCDVVQLGCQWVSGTCVVKI